jgi:hypothetical protein
MYGTYLLFASDVFFPQIFMLWLNVNNPAKLKQRSRITTGADTDFEGLGTVP